jgi:integrase
MRREIHRLTAKAVENQKRAGYFCDGGGLYLQVTPARAKSWIFRFTLGGKPREMGLGGLLAIGLAEARKRAAECRHMLVDGIDPIEARRAHSAQQALSEARTVSFEKCAQGYIAAHGGKWKNPKHAGQWKATLETYCYPVIGALPVQSVDTGLIVKVLQPIWTTKPETASRLRGRIQSVLDWATVSGYRTGDNPARWRGHLDKLLAGIPKEARVKHHAALAYADIGAFMKDLRTQDGTAARALEFLILTAARTGEVIGARPEEFDLAKALWTVSGGRMKTGKEHRIPLASRSAQIIREQLKLGETYVFPGLKAGKPLSGMAMLMLLERMGRGDITVHGFRSSFRDWGAERTAYPSEMLEMALAHTVGDKVEAAYRRGDLFEKRVYLMRDWERHCATHVKGGKVVPMRKAKNAA